jgi:glutamate synthase (NADPH/NADH) small chain
MPLCAKGCPAATPIPQVMTLFLEGKLEEAGKLLFDNNPLSAITSIVCPHDRNCKGHCILGKKGQPIEFFKIEQYISRFYLETYRSPRIEKNGKKVAVVGAGPAGLTMSILLAQKGYSITLFEEMDSIGGAMRYGIPEFRLNRSIFDYYYKILDSLGVKFRPNTRIGTNFCTEDMFLDGYDAVFLCTGTNRPNRFGLLGETLGHVHFAVDYLRSPDVYKLGRNVVILGAGNVAMDAARTAIRKQHAEVTILNYRGPEDVTADKAELEMALIDGVKLFHNCQVVRIMDNSVKCVKVDKIVAEDGSESFKEDFKSAFELPADAVIIAIGQGPGSDVVSVGSAKVTQRGLLQADEFGCTSQSGVFAGGDVVTGPRTVIEAIASAKKASEKIEEYCNNV